MTGAEALVRGHRLPFAALAAVLLATALAVVAGARSGALALAAVLLVAAAVRGLVRSPGPVLAIRSRWFDVGVLVGLALVIAAFAATTRGV